MQRRNLAYKGQPEGNVGLNVVQVPPSPSSTPLSPDEKRMDVPRAPSCAYALQRFLTANRVNKRKPACDRHSENIRREVLRDERFREPEASRENGRGSLLRNESVDKIKETTQIATIVGADSEERGGDVSGHPHSVLNVQGLSRTLSATICHAMDILVNVPPQRLSEPHH